MWSGPVKPVYTLIKKAQRSETPSAMQHALLVHSKSYMLLSDLLLALHFCVKQNFIELKLVCVTAACFHAAACLHKLWHAQQEHIFNFESQDTLLMTEALRAGLRRHPCGAGHWGLSVLL